MAAKNAGLTLDEMGEVVQEKWEDRCRYPGCDGWYRQAGQKYPGTGKGYCAKHYRRYLRHGEVDLKHEQAADALLVAAIKFGEEVDLYGLGLAAVKAHSAAVRDGGDPGPVLGLLLNCAQGAKLAAAARAYRDHDAEAPLSDFLAVQDAFRRRAAIFAHDWRRYGAERPYTREMLRVA